LKSQDKQTEEERRRLRCLGHIINLAAQAFLFSKNIKAFEDGDLADLETAYHLWQRIGPVGQIHKPSSLITRDAVFPGPEFQVVFNA
jgi:hypothetical protein